LRSSAVEFGSLDVDSLEDLLIEQGLLDNYWQQMSQIYTKRAFEREKIVAHHLETITHSLLNTK